MATDTHASRLMAYVRRLGVVRTRDLDEINVPREVLKRLVDRGELARRSRGVYSLPQHEPTRHTDLAEVCARASNATVCLITALDFHELTTQIPHVVWLMIERSAWRARIEYPPIEVVYASGRSLTAGVELHEFEGVQVPITDPAKTVADCFKYRHHVGQDVAVEALRNCLRQRKATPSQLYEMAKLDRVAKRIGPYIEALI
ncbi:MAG: type IV toxin-antitoxin system AbiEi family antitoxin domain-containing protein [bacterium]